MPMTFTARGGQEPAEHFLQVTAAIRPTVGDALYAGQILRSRILERTRRGVDVDGVPFKEYSDGYRKQKTKQLGSADTVDLFGFERHPHMLNALTVSAGGHRIAAEQTVEVPVQQYADPINLFEIGFYDDETALRAKVHNEGLGRQPKREFFAASQEDLRLMEFAIGERAVHRAKALG